MYILYILYIYKIKIYFFPRNIIQTPEQKIVKCIVYRRCSFHILFYVDDILWNIVEVLGEKPVPLSLGPPQIPHGSNPRSRR